MKFIGKLKFKDWVSLSAVIISLISLSITLIRGCSQDKKIEELNYANKAVEFRPCLEVIGNPEIISVEFASEKMPVSKFYESHSDTIDIPSFLTMNAKLRLVNTGNSRAKVYASFWQDTLSGDPKIRDLLLDKKARAKKIRATPVLDYFWLKEVRPSDTVSFDMSDTVRFVEGNKFTIHFLLLYENESHVLYDTYYWARYIADPIVVELDPVVINGKISQTMTLDKNELEKYLKLHDHNSSSRIYSGKEAEDILKFLRSRVKKTTN